MIRSGIDASVFAASILSGQLSTAASFTSVFKGNPDQNSTSVFKDNPDQNSTTVSTTIPDQNTTAVSIRGGLGAAASILSGQLSTADDSGKKKSRNRVLS